MRNLLERMKPEYKAALDAERGLYPNTVASIEKALSETYFLMDLRYGVVMDLNVHIKYGTKRMEVDIWDVFEKETQTVDNEQ